MGVQKNVIISSLNKTMTFGDEDAELTDSTPQESAELDRVCECVCVRIYGSLGDKDTDLIPSTT